VDPLSHPGDWVVLDDLGVLGARNEPHRPAGDCTGLDSDADDRTVALLIPLN
jgi:hypothetical protein